MKGIGGLMVLMGAGSFVLNMMGRELVLIMWIDNWGPTVGLAIRIALIAVGAILWFMGHKQESASQTTSAE